MGIRSDLARAMLSLGAFCFLSLSAGAAERPAPAEALRRAVAANDAAGVAAALRGLPPEDTYAPEAGAALADAAARLGADTVRDLLRVGIGALPSMDYQR